MTGKSPVRSIEDVDAAALSYAEVKMLATGDERVKEKMDLDIQVANLKMLKAGHLSQQYEIQDRVARYYPRRLKETLLQLEGLEADLPVRSGRRRERRCRQHAGKWRTHTMQQTLGNTGDSLCSFL